MCFSMHNSKRKLRTKNSNRAQFVTAFSVMMGPNQLAHDSPPPFLANPTTNCSYACYAQLYAIQQPHPLCICNSTCSYE
jgi:hypothetical protein